MPDRPVETGRTTGSTRVKRGLAEMLKGGLIMAAPSEMRRRASPRLVAPHTKGTAKGHLSMWWTSSAGVRTSLSSM